jgi:hypothetical protein
MDDNDEVDETARAFFLAKIVNGRMPEVAVGGEQDALRYFPLELWGETYWLTEQGLVEISGADV